MREEENLKSIRHTYLINEFRDKNVIKALAISLRNYSFVLHE